MKLRNSISFCLILTAMGCANQEFHRDHLREDSEKPAVINDTDIKSALDAKAQLPQPFKLAVYFKDSNEREREHGYSPSLRPAWRWKDEDKAKLLSAFEHLKHDKQISEVFLISRSVVNAVDIKSLRLVAAQHGADALLVVSGEKDTSTSTNGLAVTYIALIPMLFVNGTEVEAVFESHASMWDVRNQFLYLTADADGDKRLAFPAAYTNDDEVIEKAKAESLQKLSARISSQLDEMTVKKQQPVHQ